MKEKVSPLHSEYIIDGLTQDLTPAQMLDDSLVPGTAVPAGEACGQIVDETVDPKPVREPFDSWKVQDYLADVSASVPVFPVAYAAQYTRIRIADALSDALWRDGHFRLGDLQVSLDWKWEPSAMGHMASFYSSAQAAGEYVDSLGVAIGSYSYEEASSCELMAKASLCHASEDDEDLLEDMPFHTEDSRMDGADRHPSTVVDDPDSWIVYVPLETCPFRLGGSALSQVTANEGGAAPELSDPDYFMDCYEVLREMVEDDVVIAGTTVGAGGLMPALKRFSAGRTGIRANLRELMDSFRESDTVRLLFAEVPGVLIQIRDNDFDYVDAEFTLQDVSFYPLGHPTPGKRDIRVEACDKSGIQTILESLIRSQSSEGED